MQTDKSSQSATVMTIDEVADGLKVSTKTVARLLRREAIHGIKIGGQWRIPVDEYQRVLHEGVGIEPEPA